MHKYGYEPQVLMSSRGKQALADIVLLIYATIFRRMFHYAQPKFYYGQSPTMPNLSSIPPNLSSIIPYL